jgi:ribosomal silencing factor RsfS
MFQRIARSVQHAEAQKDRLEIEGLDKQKITLSKDKESGKVVFPIRPLVSAGDDVTFVADGRIGLDLAVTFLEAFEAATETILADELARIDLPKLTACAGAAIVKSHYPFARAYALADELAGSAKDLVNKQASLEGSNHLRYSALDWHFTTGGIYDDLDGIRAREYEVEQGSRSLTLRPIFVQPEAHEFRNWTILRALATEFQTKWRDNRGKAKRLMNALRQGEVEVEVFNLRYLDNNLRLPSIADFDQHYGWRDDRCGYYDGLELLDLYVPLRQ